MIERHVVLGWCYNIHKYACLQYGEHVDARCATIQLSPGGNNNNTYMQKIQYISPSTGTDVYGFIDSLEETSTLDVNTDSIQLDTNAFPSDSQINHPLTSPRVIGIITNESNKNTKKCVERTTDVRSLVSRNGTIVAQ